MTGRAWSLEQLAAKEKKEWHGITASTDLQGGERIELRCFLQMKRQETKGSLPLPLSSPTSFFHPAP